MSAFDRLQELCIKNSVNKTLLHVIDNARIFNIDDDVNISINVDNNVTRLHYPDIPDILETEELRLFLPFPTTALVFRNSCTVFTTGEEVYPESSVEPNTFIFITLAYLIFEKYRIETVTIGAISALKRDAIVALAESAYDISGKGKFRDLMKPMKGEKETKDSITQNQQAFGEITTCAYLWLKNINTVDRFILEVTPINNRTHSNKYARKSHQRSEYIILHPNEIRKRMKTESDIEGHKKAGHERRAHLRRYPDDKARWPKCHGKVIKIDSVWIGRTEAIVGNKQYKVILD